MVKGDTVYDKKTDLTWSRCSVGQKWEDAVGCVGKPKKFTHDQANTAGWSDGWRMPTKDELTSIVALHCKEPVIDEEIFPGTPSEWYHTASKDGTYCWSVSFSDGTVDYFSRSRYRGTHPCEIGSAVRLVRGGQ
jgi:hypothetical protein